MFPHNFPLADRGEAGKMSDNCPTKALASGDESGKLTPGRRKAGRREVESAVVASASLVALIAQLDRASDYGSEGSRFNSWWVHHSCNGLRLSSEVLENGYRPVDRPLLLPLF